MYEIMGLLIFFGIGLGIWRSLIYFNDLYEQNVPESIQEKIYETSKDLPKIAWDWFIGGLFWTSAGATAIQVVASLFGFQRLLPAANWAPGVLLILTVAVLATFWESPHRLKSPAKSRGRKISQSLDQVPKSRVSPTPPAKRGRTIRSYREIK